jgi:TPP-dependent pyruvate/acetoin dehydrogenase alpha subunit
VRTAQQVDMLKRMVLIREFEKEAKRLYRRGEIVGALHLYIGQEAVAVGACATLRDDDYVTSTHRSHGHALAKGLEPNRTMAELMGRETGHSKGRGGSMHIFDMTKGFLGGNGIVGGGIPIALGAAFTAQYEDTDRVAVCLFSDGAANQGVLAESLNMAALWKLPVIYLCENNQCAATTTPEKSASTVDIAPRAAGYGVPWAIADGNDVMDVHRVMTEAVLRARTGEGPTFVECKTYRVEPHCGIIADPRNKEELTLWRSDEKDPIARMEALLVAEEILTNEEIAEIHAEVEQELAEAVEFARASAFPDVGTVAAGLWAET